MGAILENVSAELGILKDIQLAVRCGVVCRGLGDRRAIERDIGFTSATSASLIVKLNELREVGDRDASRGVEVLYVRISFRKLSHLPNSILLRENLRLGMRLGMGPYIYSPPLPSAVDSLHRTYTSLYLRCTSLPHTFYSGRLLYNYRRLEYHTSPHCSSAQSESSSVVIFYGRR